MKKILLVLLLALTTTIKGAHPKILPFENPDAILDFVKDFLPEKPVILEAGAWNGLDTVRMANKWPAGIIHTFEPIPENFVKLITVTQGYKNIKQYPIALAEADGMKDMYVSQELSTPNTPSGSSSLLPPKEHLKHDSNIVFPNHIQVKALTVNSWAKLNKVNNIDFMWLDMQGYELPTLKHSLEILKSVRVIFTEMLFIEAYAGQAIYKDIQEWLEAHGFVLVAIDYDEAHAAKGKAIKPGERYFGNAVFVNKAYLQK